MLTVLAKIDHSNSAHLAAKSRREVLLEEFLRLEKTRGRELTNEEIWAGIESDDDAYSPSNDELEKVLSAHKAKKT